MWRKVLKSVLISFLCLTSLTVWNIKEVQARTDSDAYEYDYLGYEKIGNCVSTAIAIMGQRFPTDVTSWDAKVSIINSYTPIPGAIAISKSPYATINGIYYGHVAYVESVSGNQVTTLNGGYGLHVKRITSTASEQWIVGYYYPPGLTVKPDASWVTPTVNLDQNNGNLSVTWPAVNNAETYWIRVDNVYENSIAQAEARNRTFTTTLPRKGVYSVYISANNSAGYTYSQRVYLHYRGIPSDQGNNRIVRIKENAKAGNRYMYYDSANDILTMKSYSSSASEQSKYLYKLLKQSDGSYMLQSMYDTSKYVDIDQNYTANSTRIKLCTISVPDAQQFWIIPSDFGGYTINKKGTSQVFDKGGGTGTTLYTFTHTSEENQNQYFNFEDVNTAPTAVSLNTKNATLSIGNGFKLKANVSPSYANSKVTWRSSTPAVASVDANGNVKALRPGATYIIAKTSNGKEVKCLVKVVEIKAKSVSVNTTKATLSIGSSFKAKATVYPTNTSNKTVTWRSSSPKVASVDANGNVKASRAGSTYIIARTANGKEKKILVKVVSVPVSSVKMNLSTAKLAIGKTFNANGTVYPTNASNKTVTYSSSNTKVLKVDKNGKVTTVGAGTAYVYAKSNNGKVGKILVQVYPNPTSVKITPNSATVRKGTTFQARTIVTPSNATKNITYYTTNERVAKVSSDGKVTAVGAGKTYVYAKTHNGKTARFLITVIDTIQHQTYVENGVYTLTSPNGTLALDVIAGLSDPYTRTQVFLKNDTPAQNLMFINRGNNVYTISPSYAQHMVLDVYRPSGPITEGNKVDIYPYNEPEAQEWILTKLTNGNYIIRLKSNPSLVLTRGGTYDASGNAIYVGWYSESFDLCQWKLIRR